MKYRVSRDGSIPIAYCARQKRWLPVDEHLECDYCAGPVFDENDEPESFLCTYEGGKHDVKAPEEHPFEDGRGAPTHDYYEDP